MRLRLATRADIPALQDLIARSARSLSVDFYSPAQTESAITHVFGVDTQLLDDGTFFVVENEHGLTGCGGWSRRSSLYGSDKFKGAKPDPELDPEQEPARIRAFFVHPDWKRKGIGSRILSACEKAAAKAGFKALELGATLPGVPFYHALGFEPLDKVELKFPDGVRLDIIRMRKALTK